MKTAMFVSLLLLGGLCVDKSAVAQTSNPSGSIDVSRVIAVEGDNSADPAFAERMRHQNELHNAAKVLLTRKLWKAAEAKFKEAIAVDPEYVSPYAYAGIAEAAYAGRKNRGCL